MTPCLTCAKHSLKVGFCCTFRPGFGCCAPQTLVEIVIFSIFVQKSKFLQKIGLEKDITFEAYNPEGYDHMVMPDGKCVKIPYGYDKLVKNIEAAYPGQEKAAQKFTTALTKIENEIEAVTKTHRPCMYRQSSIKNTY